MHGWISMHGRLPGLLLLRHQFSNGVFHGVFLRLLRPTPSVDSFHGVFPRRLRPTPSVDSFHGAFQDVLVLVVWVRLSFLVLGLRLFDVLTGGFVDERPLHGELGSSEISSPCSVQCLHEFPHSHLFSHLLLFQLDPISFLELVEFFLFFLFCGEASREVQLLLGLVQNQILKILIQFRIFRWIVFMNVFWSEWRRCYSLWRHFFPHYQFLKIWCEIVVHFFWDLAVQKVVEFLLSKALLHSELVLGTHLLLLVVLELVRVVVELFFVVFFEDFLVVFWGSFCRVLLEVHRHVALVAGVGGSVVGVSVDVVGGRLRLLRMAVIFCMVYWESIGGRHRGVGGRRRWIVLTVQ